MHHLSSKQQQEIKLSGLWNEKCQINPAELRLIKLSYYDFSGQSHHDGELLIHKSAAKPTVSLFKELYFKKFPFSSISTLLKYNGSSQLAEEKNVTYGFICDESISSSGKVLTINPAFNPQIKYIDNKIDQFVVINPKAGIFTINRNLKLKGMMESVIGILRKHQFVNRQPDINQNINQIDWKHYIFTNKMQTTPTHSTAAIKMMNPVSEPIFSYQALTAEQKKNLIESKTWTEKCPVPLDRLSMLTLSHYGFDGEIHVGTLIMFDGLAPSMTRLFKKLYQSHFPIEKFDVNVSSEDENTSGFACRDAVGKNKLSLHAYGMALDMNIWHNPYIGAYKIKNAQMIGTLIPSSLTSLQFLHRNEKKVGMNERITKILAKHGLIEWGGDWQDTIDYMHFQVPRAITRHLALLDTKSAEQFIELMSKYPQEVKRMSADTRWDKLYLLYQQQYIQVLKKYLPMLKSKSENEVIHLIYNELNK